MRLLVLLAACSAPVHGRLVDAFTGAPVAAVWVATDDGETRSGADGAFALAGPSRGRLSLGGACALDPLDYASRNVGAIRIARWRGSQQRVPDGIVAIEGMPASSDVLRDCMPDRPVRATLADGTTTIVRPLHFE